jgi:hypothetical protein
MKQATRSEFNSFVKGLITEASALNFPENAYQEGYNFTLNKTGKISRRPGMDFENDHQSITATGLTLATSQNVLPKVYKWEAAGGDPSVDILVVQDRNIFYFYNMDSESLSNGFIYTITLDNLSSYSEFSMTDAEGLLIIVCGDDSVTGVEYLKNAAIPFAAFPLKIQTRDLWGVDSTNTSVNEDVSFRPTDIDDGHVYNLQNQSWGIPRRANIGGLLIDPVAHYKTQLSKYPSQAEQVWTGMQFAPSGDPKEVMYSNLWEESLGATSTSTKGYYIIDAVNRGTSRAEAFAANKAKYPELTYSSITTSLDRTIGGPSVVASFAGRVFYAGFGGEVIDGDSRSPTLINHVFFSRLVRNKADLGKCYQEGDPSSRENTDIVDTDGGFIPIAEAKKIIAMEPVAGAMVVFATNGVWAILGGSDYGFGATNYKVDKISSFGILTNGSIVSEGDKCFYWSKDAIFVITKDQFGALQVQSLSDTTIQSYYLTIPEESKFTVRAGYDGLLKQIKWIYQIGGLFQTDSYAEELILDLNLGAFFVNKVFDSQTENHRPVAIVSSSLFRNPVAQEEVVAVGEAVTVEGGDVYIEIGTNKPISTNNKYLVLTEESSVIKFSFAVYNNAGFKDWGSTDAYAKLLTGDMSFGSSAVDKTLPYLVVHMEPTENAYNADVDEFLNESGCQVSTSWGWARNTNSLRWSRKQQAYRPNRKGLYSTGDFIDEHKVVTSKLKMRGTGKALSIQLETEPDKDCIILGWSTVVSGNSSV